MTRLLLSFLTLALAQATSTQLLRRTPIDNSTTFNGIVGGSAAESGEFPWFASFVPAFCGGSLISGNRVLTAAHCIVGGAPEAVRIGASTTSDGQEIAVTCGQYHPDYRVGSSGDLFNDVAVLKLAGSSSVTPISLNDDTSFPSAGTPLRVIGFGATSQGGSQSNVLKKLDTAAVSISTCQNNYPDVEFGTHVCGNVDNEGDCQGDSGGPLFFNNELQVGVVSYGIGCAQPSEDVYGGIAKYNAWIQEQINNDDCNVNVGSTCWLDRIFGCLETASRFLFRGLFY